MTTNGSTGRIVRSLILMLAVTIGGFGSLAHAEPAESYVPYVQPGWGNGADPEPNTEYDTSFMWSGPTTTQSRLYLDAFVVQEGGSDTSMPAAGTVGAVYRVFAFFGVWKDCNRDHVIGAPGALEYATLALLDHSSCPVAQPPEPPSYPYPNYNDGHTVRELQWILSTEASARLEQDGIYGAPTGRVWAKLGRPYDTEHAVEETSVEVPGIVRPVRVLQHGGNQRLELTFQQNVPATAEGTPVGMGAQSADPSRIGGAALCSAGLCTGWWSDPFVVEPEDADAILAGISDLKVTVFGHGYAGTYAKGIVSPGGSLLDQGRPGNMYEVRDTDRFGEANIASCRDACVRAPPPPTIDFLSEPDTTKVGIGHTCDPGSVSFVCEAPDCMGTPGLDAPCAESSTCFAYVQEVCVAGVNQRKVGIAANDALRGVSQEDIVPALHLVSSFDVAIGGDCAAHDVGVACNYRPSGPECIDLGNLFAPARDCGTPAFTCPGYAAQTCTGAVLVNCERSPRPSLVCPVACDAPRTVGLNACGRW
jgi:hypothetical protein